MWTDNITKVYVNRKPQYICSICKKVIFNKRKHSIYCKDCSIKVKNEQEKIRIEKVRKKNHSQRMHKILQKNVSLQRGMYK